MDASDAKKLAAEMKGKVIGGWTVGDSINNGKSAVVLHATRGTEVAALKVFDRELVEKYGRETQSQRVARERELVGKTHEHLVKIFDAGEDTAYNVFFVAMQLLPWANLADVIEEVPRDKIHPLIRQVASAAHFLEGNGLAHRDIKPQNIVVSPDFAQAVLLDLGVLGPIGNIGAITDHGAQKIFIGTLQYSAPEFLFRDEEDTPDGWRSVTFYQLGAVLHDLIMRRPLFVDSQQPFGNLVRAVERTKPLVEALDVPRDLLQLCRNCLVKDPVERRALVSWESFARYPASDDDQSAALRRIRERRATAAGTAARMVVVNGKALNAFRSFLDGALRDVADRNELPSRSVDVNADENGLLARVAFLASADDGLAVSVVVYFDVSITNIEDDILRIRVASKLVRAWKEAASERPAEARFRLLFHGVRDDAAITAALAGELIIAVDEAGEALEESIPLAENEKWLAARRASGG
ncbi:protein kinase domain-containing protein [Myxococcus xanthus]|uniref:protein kinase domain-containing protein n=1 Tax=Myxococcus xanthus TaxID=34 RepID=UPI001126DA50|nr:protein kinase [Myxococcus xanthus]QDF05188.1 hypothetical protein BHS04_18555 [Myxococcus xanthus]